MGKTFAKQWCQPIENLPEDERKRIAAWALETIDRDSRYYAPLWKRGRTCLEYVEGKIFSLAELEEFANREVVPIQTPELKPALDSIMGELLNTGKSGAVTAVGPEDAAGANVRTVIIKAVERENQLRFREAQIARDTFTTSVPGWAWIEAYDPTNPDEPGLTVLQEEWDGVIPDCAWTDRQMRNLGHATRIRQWSIEDIERYVKDPEIRAKMVYEADSMSTTLGADYSGRDTIVENIRASRQKFTQTGQLAVFEMTHWVRMRMASWYDPVSDDSGIIPQNWGPNEINSWMQQNPQIQLQENDNQRVLWVTTITSTGILLANGPHWLQAGVFPGIPCVPDRINGKWAGLIEFVLDVVKAGAYSETEWAHSVRTLNNNLLKVRKGAVADMDALRREMATPNGIVEIEMSADMDSVQFVENRREQKAFADWKESTREQLSRLLVPDNFVGGTQSSQEANSAIETRIQQTLSRLAPVVWGWHAFRLQIRRVLTKAMPYAITTQKAFRHIDPKNGDQTVEVNTPAEYDVYGDVVRTMNNLAGDEYDYIEIESDDSLTGQEFERQQFGAFMEKWGNLPPDALIQVAKNYPNVSVQRLGRDMEESAKNTPPPAPEVKASVTLPLDKLAANPLAQKAAIALNILKPEDIEKINNPNGLPPGGPEPILPEAMPSPDVGGGIEQAQMNPQMQMEGIP
ncbi:MAG: hypothetical protein IPM06_18585 [Rhizobiales bacterium]|nr:hypothetical protein [Hyphomicrobiales bacterium]